MGTVFFWTFIIDPKFRNSDIDSETLDSVETLLSRRTRAIMRINVAILALSGITLLYFHTMGAVLWIKVVVALTLVSLFYLMPTIHTMLPQASRAAIHDKLHYVMFGGMLIVLVCAKLLYF